MNGSRIRKLDDCVRKWYMVNKNDEETMYITAFIPIKYSCVNGTIYTWNNALTAKKCVLLIIGRKINTNTDPQKIRDASSSLMSFATFSYIYIFSCSGKTILRNQSDRRIRFKRKYWNFKMRCSQFCHWFRSDRSLGCWRWQRNLHLRLQE